MCMCVWEHVCWYPLSHAHAHTRMRTRTSSSTRATHFSVSVTYRQHSCTYFCYHVIGETYPLAVIGYNVALGGTARQTTTKTGPNNTADLAIDGDFKSCAATEIQSYPVWAVQLTTHCIVHEVIVSAGAIRHGKLFIYDFVENIHVYIV